MQSGQSLTKEHEEIEKLKSKIAQLKSIQVDLDTTLCRLQKETRDLEKVSPPVQGPDPEIASHYSYINPLVEEVCLLELREKELKEEYSNKLLSNEARHLGQQLLAASLNKEDAVLRTWYEEFKKVQKSQPALSTTSAESQEYSTVHNIVYNCVYDWNRLIEDLAVTIIYQGVHARVVISSSLSYPNIHCFSPKKTELTVSCDTYIPGLEETVTQSLEDNSSVNRIISHIGAYIASDMAPFVISIPIKKKSKKKKMDLEKDKSKEPQQKNQENTECSQKLKDVYANDSLDDKDQQMTRQFNDNLARESQREIKTEVMHSVEALKVEAS